MMPIDDPEDFEFKLTVTDRQANAFIAFGVHEEPFLYRMPPPIGEPRQYAESAAKEQARWAEAKVKQFLADGYDMKDISIRFDPDHPLKMQIYLCGYKIAEHRVSLIFEK